MNEEARVKRLRDVVARAVAIVDHKQFATDLAQMADDVNLSPNDMKGRSLRSIVELLITAHSGILPCPHCGGAAMLVYCHPKFEEDEDSGWCVICQTGECGSRTTLWFEALSAIRAWNLRVSAPLRETKKEGK